MLVLIFTRYPRYFYHKHIKIMKYIVKYNIIANKDTEKYTKTRYEGSTAYIEKILQDSQKDLFNKLHIISMNLYNIW